MVMEPPSPQCVGREFVRQYYTLLNQAPLHLHRFYSHNSSFLHGGGDIGDKETEAVYGQQDIHQKIMQLNFRDCHAKIRQVDSHATLERGVVVQVSGELSNNGQPMRRFMQTFVLAPQSPKKYYVHNDIFRYQDEVFNDEDVDNVGTADTSNTSRDNGGTTRDNGGTRTEEARMEEPMDAIIKPAPVQAVVMQEVAKPMENVLMNNETHLNGSNSYSAPVEEQPSMEVEDPAAQAMGVWKPEDIAEAPPVVAPAPDTNVWNPAVPPPAQPQVPAEEGSMDEQEDDPEESPMTPTAEVPVSNEPRTWSSIASGGSKGGASKPPMAPQGQPSVPPSRSESKEGTPSSQYGGAANKPYRGNRGTSQGRQSTGGGPRPERFQRDEDESSRSRMASVSDSQQLFVGNLPHNCTEKDLRELFSTFGKVTDLRINQKTGRENQSKPGREGVKVPNFGFIVFDNGEAVEKALKAKPILLFGSHRLNVEEKKMRTPRDNMGGGQGGFNFQMTAAATCHVCGKVYDGHHNRYVNEHNLSQHMKSKQAHTKISVLSPQSKSNQVSRPPPGLVYLPGQAGTPIPQSWHQVGQVGTPNPQSWHQVGQVGTPNPQSWHQMGQVGTPVSRSWDQMGQVNTPFQLGYQVGISPLLPPDQISQGSRPLLLGYQVASTLQPRDHMGQVIGTPPIPWGQECQVRRPLSRPLEKVAQVVTPPRRLGDQLGRIGTPPRRLGDEVGRIGTQPPRLGDQLGYICVTNDDNRIVGQGFVHLPLNTDYTLSAATLKEVFPDATGLYYYSSDNMLMGVLQHNDKLFPPSSGDEVLYITRKMLDSSGGSHCRMKEECPVIGFSDSKECCSVGNHFRMKEEFPVSGLSAPKECCTCSELKTQVDEMTVAIKELRTEISELKYSQISTQNGSELDENANMFKPALTLSDREALKNYQIKRPGNVDKNKIHEEMEKCMVAKSAKNIENEGHQLFDDIVHTRDIHQIDKCVDLKMFALNNEEIDLQKMEKCDEVKTNKLSNDNTGIQTMKKCVQLEKVELVDEKESIEEIEKCMKMKNGELIDLVSDKSSSLANEKSRKPIINTRTASWVLNLPNVPVKTESEIPSKISQIITSKAKLIHGNSIDKSVNSNNIDSNEKPTSFQLEENLEGRNLLSSNQLISMNTNNQLKTDESSSCDKSKKLVTLRPKLCSKKSGKESSNQLVNSKVLEKGGIYDSDQSVKNHQLESNEKSDSTQSSDQTPMHAKVGIINNQSRIKNDSSTVSSNHPNIVTFHVQRGSSVELTEKLVYDFFCSNYGKVNSVEYRSSSGKGIVHFASNITKDVFYKEIEIDDCTVYTSRRLQDLTEESVKNQILLESRHLTLGWDRSIILRKHFEKFGKVLGVVFIGNKGEIKRAIVGFDEEKVAERLVGVTEVINGARVMIQRVNSKTI